MLKKHIAILMMFIAYAIMIGHEIVPHHHHHNVEEVAEHHTDHHHHSTDDGGLSHLLSHFIHSADGFTFSPNHKITNNFSKPQLSFVALLPDNFAFDEFLTTSFQNNPPEEHFVYISPHSHPSGLRAPPAAII